MEVFAPKLKWFGLSTNWYRCLEREDLWRVCNILLLDQEPVLEKNRQTTNLIFLSWSNKTWSNANWSNESTTSFYRYFSIRTFSSSLIELPLSLQSEENYYYYCCCCYYLLLLLLLSSSTGSLLIFCS